MPKVVEHLGAAAGEALDVGPGPQGVQPSLSEPQATATGQATSGSRPQASWEVAVS